MRENGMCKYGEHETGFTYEGLELDVLSNVRARVDACAVHRQLRSKVAACLHACICVLLVRINVYMYLTIHPRNGQVYECEAFPMCACAFLKVHTCSITCARTSQGKHTRTHTHTRRQHLACSCLSPKPLFIKAARSSASRSSCCAAVHAFSVCCNQAIAV